MAKSTNGKSDKSQIEEAAEDAVEVSEEVLADDPEGSSEAIDADEAEEILSDDTAGAEPEEDEQSDESAEPHVADEPTDTYAAEVTEPSAAAEPSQKSSTAGFFPLLLGGVVAGALGYAFAIYGPNNGAADDLQATLDAQSARISDLQAKLDAQEPVDLTGIETQISDLADEVAAMSALDPSDELAALDARLTDLEKLPSGDGTLSDTALAAYQRELDDLRAELDAQQSAVMSAAAQAEADLEAARAEAARLEQEALAAAEAAAARAAINRVATAVETGAPFADALADLGFADVPAELAQAGETGVATTAQLVADFPAAARAALATARSEGLSDDAGGLGGFLRSQFDVRSTTPQEGSGPDAVLSRAEAAVKEGRVADALAELQGLPEVARAEMTDWSSRAQARADVLEALTTLSETYQ